MLIERALEKLKQSTKGKGGRASAGGSARSRPITPPVAPAGPRAPRPDFPQVVVDLATARQNRVIGLEAHGREEGRSAAAYRLFRTKVLQKLRNNQWKNLAITSPSPGDGKTLTVLNLALNIARDKSCDVFVVDLDMRKPSICRYLGVRPPLEVVDYFEGTMDPSQVFFSIGMENLVIAAGTRSTDNASELIGSERLMQLLSYIGSISADPVVLIDLPPLLITDEALVVAPRVDATLLVVAEGKTRRDELVRARQQLGEFPFAGIVLNCASETSENAGGYYYDGSNAKSG